MPVESHMGLSSPTREDVLRAQRRIAGKVHRTPLMTCGAIDELLGLQVFFKCEHFQKTGAFKARGATNTLSLLSKEEAKAGVTTHSSGNHGAGLAYAARALGIRAIVVMPKNAPIAKRRAVASYGAEIRTCESTLAAREAGVRDVIAETGATLVHPYADPRVIAGQGTVALEILEDLPDVDTIVAPVGGGGLISGSTLVAGGARVLGAEPEMADDAATSVRTGVHAPLSGKHTIADGLRTRLGAPAFEILTREKVPILTASEEGIVAAMRLLWERAKLMVEPSGAIGVAALMEAGERKLPRGSKVAVILSGGNLDLGDFFDGFALPR